MSLANTGMKATRPTLLKKRCRRVFLIVPEQARQISRIKVYEDPIRLSIRSLRIIRACEAGSYMREVLRSIDQGKGAANPRGRHVQALEAVLCVCRTYNQGFSRIGSETLE